MEPAYLSQLRGACLACVASFKFYFFFAPLFVSISHALGVTIYIK